MGKTCLLLTYTIGRFPEKYSTPTVYASPYTATVTVSHGRWLSSLSQYYYRGMESLLTSVSVTQLGPRALTGYEHLHIQKL